MWSSKFQNATPPTVFMRSQPNFMKTLATMGEYKLLLPQFSSNFNQTLQKECNCGNTGYYYFWRSEKSLKVYRTLKINYLSYIAIIHKTMLVSSDKRSSRHKRLWASCLLSLDRFLSRICNIGWMGGWCWGVLMLTPYHSSDTVKLFTAHTMHLWCRLNTIYA